MYLRFNVSPCYLYSLMWRTALTYQSRFGLSLDDRDSLNQACWSEVWLMTRSRISFMPLSDC